MISNFSSFVEFFAAIYVTMAVNNDFCSNFWTPKYYKEMDLLLKEYDFSGSSSIHDSLMEKVKNKYENVQNRAHYRGFIVLMLCIFYLIFMGYEDETNSMSVEYYVPILSNTLLVGLTLIFSNEILKSWRRTVSCVILYVLVYVFLKCVHWYGVEAHAITIVVFNYKSLLLVAIILLPVIHQLYIYWLYSSVYKGYLKHHVSNEYERYKVSMLGIKTKDKFKVDEIYMKAWSDAKFMTNEDPTYTTFYQVLTDQLLSIASPTHWQLLMSWIKYHMKKIFSKETPGPQFEMNETNTNNEKVSDNALVQYERKDNKGLDFTNEYNRYIKWKKRSGKNGSLKNFCIERNINYKDMIAWIRINRPMLDKSCSINDRRLL